MKSQQNPASMKEYNLRVKKYLPGAFITISACRERNPIHFVKADGNRAWDGRE